MNVDFALAWGWGNPSSQLGPVKRGEGRSAQRLPHAFLMYHKPHAFAHLATSSQIRDMKACKYPFKYVRLQIQQRTGLRSRIDSSFGRHHSGRPRKSRKRANSTLAGACAQSCDTINQVYKRSKRQHEEELGKSQQAPPRHSS